MNGGTSTVNGQNLSSLPECTGIHCEAGRQTPHWSIKNSPSINSKARKKPLPSLCSSLNLCYVQLSVNSMFGGKHIADTVSKACITQT